jgi:hypothetical protein
MSEWDFDMLSFSRDRVSRIFHSPSAWRRALFVIMLFAASALAVSSKGQNSLDDYVSAICSQRFHSASTTEATYLAENVSAMTKMMFGMGIRPSGNIDSDFVAMMTPHHQGAIEMAQAELRYGHNERLKRMAQEIIVTQRDEIAAMRLAVGLPLSVPPYAASPPGSQPDEKSRSSPVQEH